MKEPGPSATLKDKETALKDNPIVAYVDAAKEACEKNRRMVGAGYIAILHLSLPFLDLVEDALEMYFDLIWPSPRPKLIVDSVQESRFGTRQVISLKRA